MLLVFLISQVNNSALHFCVHVRRGERCVAINAGRPRMVANLGLIRQADRNLKKQSDKKAKAKKMKGGLRGTSHSRLLSRQQ